MRTTTQWLTRRLSVAERPIGMQLPGSPSLPSFDELHSDSSACPASIRRASRMNAETLPALLRSADATSLLVEDPLRTNPATDRGRRDPRAAWYQPTPKTSRVASASSKRGPERIGQRVRSVPKCGSFDAFPLTGRRKTHHFDWREVLVAEDLPPVLSVVFVTDAHAGELGV